MCGIVGYIGPREAAPILLEGLARLEYRGYDSAGIALVAATGQMFVEKRAGKLANLRTALANGSTPKAVAGIAHTRWATHGRPNDLNAHPHTDCSGQITVIHNGIIENFKALRDGLRERGHKLTSDTDTEALAHLVEEAYTTDIAEATRAALRQADGAYAVAVMHAGEPQRLVGARMNVPLIVGLGEGENFVASDVAAVLAHTRRVIFLEEGDVADITPDGVTVSGIDGGPRERLVHEIDWSIEAAEKAGYDHFMLKEMHEQPGAIRAATVGRVHDHTIELDELAPIAERLAKIERIELVACGTANYASAVGAYVMQDWLGLPARFNIGSEFRYSPPPIDERTLVVAVTQSGETADTIAPTRLARERGALVIATTAISGPACRNSTASASRVIAEPTVLVMAITGQPC